jgi:hypothetical protein
MHWLPWLSVGLSIAIVGAYELWLWRAAHRDPSATARSAHRLLRADWVTALSGQAGSEILAVQALRNALMSATITASTAALALMGAVSLTASTHDRSAPLTDLQAPTVHGTLLLSLMLTLFAAYVCSAMAMRYYHHASFMMSLPVASPERTVRQRMASSHLQRAGLLYSWSLRCFLFVAPLMVGWLNPLLMPFAAVALVWVMRQFDRTPAALDASSE